MDFVSGNLLEYLRAIWRRKWLTLFAAWGVCAIGWIVIAMLPSQYESVARVYVDTDTLLTPLLRGLTVQVDPTQQLDVLQRTLLSRPNLEQVIHMTSLDQRVKTAGEKDALIQKMLASVAVRPQTQNLFTISYDDSDPVVARDVVQSLLTIFAESTTGTARAQIDSAQRFLNGQIAAYEKQLRAMETRRAQFRAEHPEVTSGALSSAGLETARMRVEQARSDLDDATARRDALRQELASVPATLSVESGAVGVGQPGPVQQELAAAQQRLAQLLLQDTEEHPDVIALKAQIAQYRQQLAGAGSGSAANEARSRRSSVPNPNYGQARMQLLEAQSQVATAQRRFSDAATQLQRLDTLARSSADVEAQGEDMDRDYGVLQRNYQELLARREAANISQAADSKADQLQFRVVDAPQVPTAPMSPNRPRLYSVVLIAGILGGLFLPILLARLDRSFATLQRVASLGLPVLGGISYVSLGERRHGSLLEMTGFGAISLALLLLYGVLIAVTLSLHNGLAGSLL